jgi:hypothetical protein
MLLHVMKLGVPEDVLDEREMEVYGKRLDDQGVRGPPLYANSDN